MVVLLQKTLSDVLSVGWRTCRGAALPHDTINDCDPSTCKNKDYFSILPLIAHEWWTHGKSRGIVVLIYIRGQGGALHQELQRIRYSDGCTEGNPKVGEQSLSRSSCFNFQLYKRLRNNWCKLYTKTIFLSANVKKNPKKLVSDKALAESEPLFKIKLQSLYCAVRLFISEVF